MKLTTVLMAALFCASPFCAAVAAAQDSKSKTVGGPGGAAYSDRCAAGEYLVGIHARSGNWVDAAAAVCAPWQGDHFGPDRIGALRGGAGGQVGDFRCDRSSAISEFFALNDAENDEKTVSLLSPRCAAALPPNKGAKPASGNRFGTSYTERHPPANQDGVGTSAEPVYDASAFPRCAKGSLAVGIRGGAGTYLDRIGLICAPAPRIPAKPTPAPKPVTRHPETQVGSNVSRFPDASTAPAAPAPGSCKPGYVWRIAKPDDLVCVSPASRERVSQENAQAASRVDPKGNYGPKSCVSGFVWREAYSGDLVCVAPEIRDLVRQENADAPSHTNK